MCAPSVDLADSRILATRAKKPQVKLNRNQAATILGLKPARGCIKIRADALAAKYNVTEWAIYAIWRGITWKSLDRSSYAERRIETSWGRGRPVWY